MSEQLSTSTELPPTSPTEAYAADLTRLQQPGPLGPSDDAWLMLGHTLSRFAGCAAAEVGRAAPGVADLLAVSAVAMGLSAESTVLRAANALRGLNAPEPVFVAAYDRCTELVVATQAVAEEQELAGAFGLAYATLYSLLAAFGDRITPRAHGNVLAQMGRAARQFGALDLASNLYDEASTIGYDCEALDVVARALLGHGTLAVTRGNYPSGREHFERALVNADLAKDTELIRNAHHGLQNCGMASGDLDAAMVHGWNVLRLCVAPDSRAEALMNMAEICRLSGEHRAALRTYAVAIEWTSQPRIRLHATSGALQSAIAIDRLATARRFVTELEDLLPTTPDQYTRASIAIEFADSLHKLGDVLTAAMHLREAQMLAVEHSFHELVHRAEQAAIAWQRAAAPVEVFIVRTRRKRPYRSENFRMVLHSLNGLTASTS